MNLQSDWGYILEVAERRLKNNRTPRHIASEKGRLEIIRAAGEVAARRFF
jgi:ankyrin repeat protein